jgi:hypothetical protein
VSAALVRFGADRRPAPDYGTVAMSLWTSTRWGAVLIADVDPLGVADHR